MAKKMGKAAKAGKKAATGAKGARAKRTVAKAVHKPAKRAAPRQVATSAVVSFPPAASPVVEDHLAIQQLLHKYCHVVDRGTADEVADLFHRTGVLLPRHESDERYEGRETKDQRRSPGNPRNARPWSGVPCVVQTHAIGQHGVFWSQRGGASLPSRHQRTAFR